MKHWNEHVNDPEVISYLKQNPQIAMRLAETSGDFSNSWAAFAPAILELSVNGSSVGEILAKRPGWGYRALTEFPELRNVQVESLSANGVKKNAPLFSLIKACQQCFDDQALMTSWVGSGLRLCDVQLTNGNSVLGEALTSSSKHFMNSKEFAYAPSSTDKNVLNIELLQDALAVSTFAELCNRNQWSIAEAISDKFKYVPDAMRMAS